MGKLCVFAAARGFKCFALTARADSGDRHQCYFDNNQITGANFMGPVGPDWQVGGFREFSSRGPSDMIFAQYDDRRDWRSTTSPTIKSLARPS